MTDINALLAQGMRVWTSDGRMPRPDARRQAVLLDRDGTLTVFGDHLVDPSTLHPTPHAVEAVRAIASTHRVAVVTNQSVVGRGMTTPQRMVAMHQRLHSLFSDIDVVIHCPHLPSVGCACRKPAPGMLVAALDLLGVEAAAATMVGDNITDLEAARGAGVRSVLVRTGLGHRHAAQALGEGHDVAVDLPDALAHIAG